ncbi:MAG: thioredoxin-disulfide reductase [Thermodesulfobacteriaceae bacterium]|nr:thioredoxin-disulfide reductase [Thermodesulfobacteriaceae bacterium]MCX8041601.1 thioredoxin-disulfide reductase [Thermodesulfobacteriaceae bacterium]MDW8136797.1 thioredoxin-disulfide reductase [Thermodesulfobacterium sp.]
MKSLKEYEVVIVGAGPAGITAYLYAKRSLLETLLIDKGFIGGQVLLIDFIENYPGFPEGISGYELVERMKAQIERLGLNFLQEEVVKLEIQDNYKLLYLRGGEILKSKSIILALGASPKKLGIPGERELTGKGVAYCATCDGPLFRDEVIAVLGGGNTALQEALFLTKFAKKIYLIHRRDSFRATPILQKRVQENEKIILVLNTVVEEIIGSSQVEKIRIKHKISGEESFLEVSGVFVFIGYQPETDWLRGTLELDSQGFILVDKNLKTSLEGVFACGDCISKEFRQIISACGEGAIAALMAEKYLNEVFKK